MEYSELELRSDVAESALLGALGFHADAMKHILESVSPSAFYKPGREAIWSAARKLADAGKPIDPGAVARQLHADNEYNQAVRRLIDSEMTTPRSVDLAEQYAGVITDLAQRRELLRVCQRATEIVATHPGSASEAFSAAQAEFGKIVQEDDDPSTLNWNQLVDEFETAHAIGGARPPIPSPWWQLDYLIGGLFGSRVYVIGARPGGSKSMTAINIATHAAVESHRQVLIFSKEMPSVDVMGRIVASRAEVSLSEISGRKLSDDSKERIRKWERQVGTLPLRVNARPCSLAQIKNQARAQHQRIGLDVLVVDYLQLVRADSGRNREQEVAQVSRELKALAMELDCVVVLPAQLNRGSVTRSDPKPTMSDLRESGSIEQDADVVILLHRPLDEYGSPIRRIHLLVDKNRHGPTGTVELDWNGEFGLIT